MNRFEKFGFQVVQFSEAETDQIGVIFVGVRKVVVVLHTDQQASGQKAVDGKLVDRRLGA